MQCVEMRGYGSWVNAGRPDPRDHYPLPDGSSPTPQPQPPKPPTPQPTPGKEITVQFTTQAVKVGERGPHVRRTQQMLNDLMGRGLATDGHCGLLTVAAIMDWQRLMRNNAATKNTAVDGIAGPVTLGSITTAWFAKA